MRRTLFVLASAALLACCGDQGAKMRTGELDIALRDLAKVEKDLTAPENALSTLWARQDARAVATCEADQVRIDLPDSREAAVAGAAQGRDLPYDDYYAGALKADLARLATTEVEDCRLLRHRLDRQILKQDDRPDGTTVMTVAVHNTFDGDAKGLAALTDAEKKARATGIQYRYTLAKAGEAWRITGIDVWDGRSVHPYFVPSNPLLDVPGL